MSTTPIVALDTATTHQALSIVDELGDACHFYKVGSELFTAVGPAIIRELRGRRADVFLDLKFHDIPSTVARAVARAADLGARLVTVHAVGGEAMLRAAVDAVADTPHCGVLAVSILTSLTASDVSSAWGRSGAVDLQAEVARLAELAVRAGAHGIVCSGQEAAAVRRRFGDQVAVLVPGVRPLGVDANDQARVVTPREAAAAGARYVVIGRAVTSAMNRRHALAGVLRELVGPSHGA